MRAVVAALLAASTLAGCASAVPVTCDAEGRNPPPALSCHQAIGAARAQYATTPDITELIVDYAAMCPPAGRGCRFPTGDLATVYAVLADGNRLFVNVSIGPDGSVRSDGTATVADVPSVVGRIAHMFDSSRSR
jgi:hypothetical protein